MKSNTYVPVEVYCSIILAIDWHSQSL